MLYKFTCTDGTVLSFKNNAAKPVPMNYGTMPEDVLEE